jgi:hypothetical protein
MDASPGPVIEAMDMLAMLILAAPSELCRG